jgi:hypothetical protein
LPENIAPLPAYSVLTELRTNRKALTLALLSVFAVATAYVLFTGLTVFMGDSFLLANRAKHLAAEFNLHLSQSPAPIIYPPLYSIVLAIAYLFQDPGAIFNATLALHVLLTTSQVIPLFLLLSQYGRLAPRPAAGFAAVLALSPASLPYTSVALTEVLFCPIVLWLIYYLSRVWTAGDPLKYVSAGVCMALALLTRSAATSLLLAFVLTCLLLFRFRQDEKSTKTGPILALVAFGAVYGAWYLFELFFIPYPNPNYIFSWSSVPGIFTDFNRLDLHASWLANCFFYFLHAPLSLAGPFSFILFLRRPALLRRDPVALYCLVAMFFSAAVPSLVLGDHWGGRDLTWNRYLMPFVVFSTLIAIRYREEFNRAMLFGAALVLAISFLAFRPSSLACHFTDALALASGPSRLPVSAALVNLAFFAIPVLTGLLWLRSGRGQRLALQLTAIFWISTHLASAIAYRNSGDLNISNYHGVAEKAYQIAKVKNSQVFYDPDIDLKDFTAAETVLYYWPNLKIRALSPKDLGTISVPPGSSLLYFTTNPVPGLEPLGMDRGALRLYEIAGHVVQPGQTVPAAPTPKVTSLSIIAGPNMPGVELGDKDGRKVPVRWLGKGADFLIDAPPGVDEVTVQLTLGTFGQPRTAALLVNGEPAAPTYPVAGDFWSSPPLPSPPSAPA